MYDDTGYPSACCGHRVIIYSGGGFCQAASLRSSEARSGLDFLSGLGTQLMVKDCRGHFRAYNSNVNTIPDAVGNLQVAMFFKPRS